jgi:3-phenylpropionate/trans-cinnamate dioxygenase ferredoxin reductase subunit
MTAKDIREGDLTAPLGAIQSVTVAGRAYALIRHAEGWSLVPDACTHSACAFTGYGEVADGTVLICNCHGAEFDLRTGEVLLGPASEPLPIIPVEIRDGVVHLPTDLPTSDDPARTNGEHAVASLRADLESCKGYANCVVAADDYLDLDDDGIVVVLQAEVAPADRLRVEEAVRSCPISALRLETN